MRFKLGLVCLFLLAGCSSPGILVTRQVGEAAPSMSKAPVDGTYGLFIAGESNDQYEETVKADQPLGFEWGDGGGPVRWMYAVAGTSKRPLDVTKTYEWRRLGE